MYAFFRKKRALFESTIGENSYLIGDISDVYGIKTGNALKGGWGHPDGYDLIPNAASLELFAHYFSAGMLNYDEKLDNIKEYMPQSNAALELYIEKIKKQSVEKIQ